MVFRFLKSETQKFIRAFLQPAFIYLTLVGNVILLTATSLVYFLERGVNPRMQTYFDSLWWGASTITTIGYGDIVPMTFWGRVVGLFLMFTGTVLFVTFTGTIVTLWMHEQMKREIDPLEKEIRKEEADQLEALRTLKHISTRLDAIEKRLSETQ